MNPEWLETTVGEACILRSGTTLPKEIEKSSGEVPYLKVADMNIGANLNGVTCSSRYVNVNDVNASNLLPAGTTIFPKRGGAIFTNKKLLTNRVICADLNIMGVTPKDGLLPEWLSYYFRNLDLREINSGSSIPQINNYNIEPLSISFPVSLREQRRIVGILDEAFEGIATARANAEKNLRNAKELFESYLNYVIQGNLEIEDSGLETAVELISQIEKARLLAIKQGRAKPEKTEQIGIKENYQFKLPNKWAWAHLESLTLRISDGVHKKPQYVANGIPFVTVRNLTAGPGISFEDLNYITQEDHQEFIKRTHPEKGDILITKDGTIGVVRLVETDIEFSIFVSVALIKPIFRDLGPFLVYALRASCVQNQIVPQGAALKHLYLVDLRKLAIPLPPLRQQKQIVAALDAFDKENRRLESICQRKLSALDELKKSLLHKAFSGQL